MSTQARLIHRFALLPLGVALFALFFGSTAQADYGLEDVSIEFHTPGGAPVTQAASHPDMSIGFRVHQTTTEAGWTSDDGQTKTVITDLPKGFYANPGAVRECPLTVFSQVNPTIWCPVDAQIGTFNVFLAGVDTSFPLYNIEASSDHAAVVGTNVVGVPIGISATITSEGGAPVIRTIAKNVNQGVAYQSIKLTLWGNPANPVHDPERVRVNSEGFASRGYPSGMPEAPFVTMPSDCGRPMVLRMQAASWQEPTNFVKEKDELAPPTGCDGLSIKHSMTIQPTESRATQPSGFDIDLKIPQNEAVNSSGTPPVRRVQVEFPTGVALSPGAADGLEGCSDQQLGLGSDSPPTCPDAAKIGSIGLDTPLLTKNLTGSVYVGSSSAEHMFRVFLVLHGPGFLLKVPGVVDADTGTGRLTATFDELPELPFNSVDMHLYGGPGSALSTPECGAHTTVSTVTAWSGQVSQAKSAMNVNAGCDQAGKFEPSLKAGLTNAVAGESTAFAVSLTRPSGQQAVADLDLTLPPGLAAKVGSVPLCPDAAAATGACPAASKVGSVVAGSGDGSSPIYVPQPGRAPTAVYLAGPYKGAPYSLSVVVPAQAGPYDLGTVVVRAALRVDPITTQVSVDSDPLPTILKGVPLRIQDLRVNVDRPDFVVSPTDCDRMRVDSTVTSTGGIVAHPSSPFRVAACGELGFRPKLSLKLSGPTHRSAHPALKATLRMPKGGANIAKAVVTLPETEFLENAHIRTVCTRVRYAAENCPKDSIYGYAKAFSPLLDQPLQGPVYLRSSNHTLPDLVASLDGPIHVDLAGRIDSPGGRIRNTFWAVPDAPVSKFILTMQGGDKGLLVNNSELCKEEPRARAEFTGQNGKSSVFNPLVKLDCGGPKKRK